MTESEVQGPGHLVGPVWQTRSGQAVDNRNMGTVSRDRLQALRDTHRDVEREIEEYTETLARLNVKRVRLRESILYWEAAEKIATEVDRRWVEGETLSLEDVDEDGEGDE